MNSSNTATDRMTPTERDYIRAFMPFYTWTKEITLIVAHFAEDNPLKAAWFLQLGKMAAQNAPLLPPYDQGDLSVSNDLISPSFVMPYGEAGNVFSGGLVGAGKGLNPAARLLFANLLVHENPSTGKPYYMPPGTPTVAGQAAPPSLLRQLYDLTPESYLVPQHNEEYATGQPVLPRANGYRPEPTGQDWTQTLLGFAGLTTANKKLAEEQAQSTASQKTAAKSLLRARRNYLRRVALLKK